MANFNEAFKRYDPKSQAKWYEWKGIKFLIAPLRNPEHQKQLTKNFKMHELTVIDDKGFGEAFKDDVAEVAFQKMHNVNGKGLVFGWDATDDNGKEMPFDQAKVIQEMFEDNSFGAWVQNMATDLLKERFKEQEEKVKN